MSAVLYSTERMKDELHLEILARWDAGWTLSEIAADLELPSRSVPLGIVHRICEADPTALKRKPERRAA